MIETMSDIVIKGKGGSLKQVEKVYNLVKNLQGVKIVRKSPLMYGDIDQNYFFLLTLQINGEDYEHI